MSQYFSYALIAVGVFTVYMAALGLLRKNKNKMRAQKVDASNNMEEPNGESESLVAFLEKFLIVLGINTNKQKAISAQLARAGINGKKAVVYYLFFQRIIQPIIFVIGLWIVVKMFAIDHKEISDDPTSLLLAFIFIVIGGLGTKLYIDNKNEKRKVMLIKTFPEALDLMLICVESGLGIDAAFGRVCREIKTSHPIVAEEFERTRFEMTVMSDRVQALQNLAERTGIPAIRALVSSLVQAERFGTSLVDTMRTIAEEQRTERMLRAEAKAARLPALITLPLIFFIMPALFMIILGPLIIKVSAQGGIFGAVGG
jgi:tight adherence protein C